MPQPRLMFENDSRHTLIYMYEPPIQKEEHEGAVDELLGTPVEALIYNLGYGNAFLHATQTGDRWGPRAPATQVFRPGGGCQWEHVVFQRAYRNAAKLIDEGNDPLRITCQRAHAKGLSVYPSLQVQAVLDPQFALGARGDLPADFPGLQLADFKHREIRDQRFALIEEILHDYPVGGFELNLNHYAGGLFFHPDEVDAGRPVMTEWVARIYQAVKQSGPQRELVLRVPASLEGCRSIGLDPEEWARLGIADVLAGESFGLMSLIDCTANFRPLIAAAQNSTCRVHAVLRNNVDSDRIGTATIEMVRAAACNYWDQGVDGLNLVHWCGNWPYGAEFYEQLRELPHPEVMQVKDKIYAIPTPARRFAQAPATDPGQSLQLPAALALDAPVQLSLPVSDDLPRWDRVGRIHEVILRLRLSRATELDQLRFALNGRPLPDQLRRTINHVYMLDAPRHRSHSSYWFIFKLNRDHWPCQGGNSIEIFLDRRDPEVTPPLDVQDVELEIRYLKGKSYYRGRLNTDPDLGPHERSTSM